MIMAIEKLTYKQRALIKELEELAYQFSLDYYNIQNYKRAERTTYLELARDKIIRGQVVIWYTLLDEHLNTEISRYLFGRKANFIRLWKTKRFRTFNYHILEELHLMQKLRFVKSIRKLPKSVAADIERLNALRNGIVHAFFPQNLKRSKPMYKGKDVFSLEGVKQLQDDMDKIFDFFGRF